MPGALIDPGAAVLLSSMACGNSGLTSAIAKRALARCPLPVRTAVITSAEAFEAITSPA